MQIRTEKLLRDLRLALSYGAVLFCLSVAVVFGVVGSAVGTVSFVLLALYALPQVREWLTDYHTSANTTIVVVGVLVFGTFAGAGLGVVTTPDAPPAGPGQQQATSDTPNGNDNDGRDAAATGSPGDASPSPTGGNASPTGNPSPVHPPTRTPTESPTDTSTRASETETPDGTRTATPNETGPIPVRVVQVIDGNTLDVRYENGSNDTVRLLGVDAPEIHGEVQPGEWEGVPDSEEGRQCLRDEGRRADDYVTSQAHNKTVRLEFDDRTDRRDDGGRLLAYVHTDDVHVNYQLALQGNGRVVDRDFTRQERFREAERESQNQGIGAWHCREAGGENETTAQSSSSAEASSSSSSPSSSSSSTPTPTSSSTPTPTASNDSSGG